MYKSSIPVCNGIQLHVEIIPDEHKFFVLQVAPQRIDPPPLAINLQDAVRKGEAPNYSQLNLMDSSAISGQQKQRQ